MADDTKYFEVIATNRRGEAIGRFSAIKTRPGAVIVSVEEWSAGEVPLDSEIQESAMILNVSQFRAFIKWGKEVTGG
ncbi:MAG: hypothetical protein H0W28_07550 [Pyrinomonadaceae bacterium]|nr:hypothetical protein [Pyrinomonadaceae bacterium]